MVDETYKKFGGGLLPDEALAENKAGRCAGPPAPAPAPAAPSFYLPTHFAIFFPIPHTTTLRLSPPPTSLPTPPRSPPSL